MLVLITDRPLIARTLREFLHTRGVYLFRAPTETGAFVCNQKDTGGVILDCVPNLARGEALCRALRDAEPDMPIAVIVPRESLPDLPADRILRDGSLPSLCDEAWQFCIGCGWRERPFSTFELSVGLSPDETFYMGYLLPLSPREHALLRCLFYRSPSPTTADDLLSLCCPDERIGISNVAVTVHAINKRAAAIDPRPLIVSVYGKGYRLRDGIV
ncbi:MAG: winged helix-turn-helix domain-containing protein [Clostridia bacterium]|nr:winged helix-turn-helix domain-containing protein [Clostridia bacterium]